MVYISEYNDFIVFRLLITVLECQCRQTPQYEYANL